MEIIDVREAKHRLQKDILSLLEEYQEDYGLHVNEIRVINMNYRYDEEKNWTFGYLDVEVDLLI